MSDEHGPAPDVACTLTPDQLADRTGEVATLRASYRGAEAREDGYTFRFEGSDEAFRAIAAFVTRERQCCSFADYTLESVAPHEETRLTVTGPEGTKTMFGQGLAERLAAD